MPGVRAVRMAAAETEPTARLLGWGMTAALLGVLVVLPLLVARSAHHRHVFVSDEAVTQTRGERITRQLRFTDLQQVRVRYDGNLGGLTGRWLNEAVVLLGTDQRGRRHGLRVSGVFVTSMRPLLLRLRDEVRLRPDLLATPSERELFEAAVAEAD